MFMINSLGSASIPHFQAGYKVQELIINNSIF